MRTFAKRALWGVLFAGGITLLGATAANAAETDGEDGLLSGTQLLAPVKAPIQLLNNAISILGTSTASGGASDAAADPAPSSDTDGAAQTSGSDATASGTQALITLELPITIADNAISLLGSSSAQSTSQSTTAAAPTTAPSSTEVTTSGSNGLLSGTQALIDVTVPVTVSNNAVAALGTSDVAPSGAGAASTAPAAPVSSTNALTDGSDSILGGSQVVAPVSVPVTATGNAISLLGTSAVQGGGDAAVPATTGGDILTTGLTGILGGTQIAAPLSIPLTIGANAIGILGVATVDGPPADGGDVPGDDPGDEPGEQPGDNPGTDTGDDPDTTPGDDPGTNPGTDTGTTPNDTGATPSGGGSAASGTGLAETGGADLAPLGLVALLLVMIGGALLRRRAHAA